MGIDEAREFVEAMVVRPGLASEAISQRAKQSIESASQLFSQFRRLGDLVRYMERFRGDPGTEVYRSLRSAGLLTFEDIREEFLRRFGAWRDDRTRLDDFNVGATYGAYDLLIFAGVYDPRSGGILPIGRFGDHRAVFIRATLSGGKYANAWIEPGDRLKYYLFSIQGQFDEGFQANMAIIDYPDAPVYAFVRDTGRDRFRLAGLFRSAGVHAEEDGAKWFDLVRLDAPSAAATFRERDLAANLAASVAHSRSMTREERRKRLSEARRIPPVVVVSTTTYLRNPDVIVEVLDRAGGVCEGCGRAAPFARNTDRSLT